MEFIDLLKQRRSYRQYTEEPISQKELNQILEAGLLAPSGRNIKPEELILVTDKSILKDLSNARVGASKMLEKASACIVVLGDGDQTDVWVEDCSNVILTMHYMAASLGLGSCWIQGRNRIAPNDETTEDYVRNILHFPSNMHLEAILSLGHIKEPLPPKEVSEDLLKKVHGNKY